MTIEIETRLIGTGHGDSAERARGAPRLTCASRANRPRCSVLGPSALVLGVVLSIAGCASALPAVRAGLPPQNTPAFAHYLGTIDIVVKGIPVKRGKLYVELYDRAGYFSYERVLNERIVPVTGATMEVRLEHVPQGRYVVAVSQDANENRALDTGLFGVPTEAYGFSRDARGTFGPPDFEEAAFDFDGKTASLTVHVD